MTEQERCSSCGQSYEDSRLFREFSQTDTYKKLMRRGNLPVLVAALFLIGFGLSASEIHVGIFLMSVLAAVSLMVGHTFMKESQKDRLFKEFKAQKRS